MVQGEMPSASTQRLRRGPVTAVGGPQLWRASPLASLVLFLLGCAPRHPEGFLCAALFRPSAFTATTPLLPDPVFSGCLDPLLAIPLLGAEGARDHQA